LFRDPALSFAFKLIPVAVGLYVLFPADFLPDLVPGLGQIDDLTVAMLGLKLFLDACPSAIVERHLAQMTSVEASYRVVDESGHQAASHSGLLEAPGAPGRADDERTFDPGEPTQ
jgi:uncharacterized membrane protein YkvA (DUF1232 family)